ncbi:WxcM-like domain-containing protein [Algoriphagus sp. AK58]|uniref:WxcM-like domain-containing protein n=1 Tax=Algoriphagus sp. AK58 TaxID=1406877 RepID=UPI00164FF45E|nr:WxcM-like domain-containing protein [Algoriphagus sp. AK58]MBC6369200.1 hypothetical protein [Algoriphagus sp. AK58]
MRFFSPIAIPVSSHKDERGIIKFCNEIDLQTIRRFYVISSSEGKEIRAWQAHKTESKFILPLSGVTKIVAVEILNFLQPKSGKIFEFILDSNKPELLIIPCGFANGIQLQTQDSSVMVFSDLTLDESKNDDFRYNKDLFYNW